MLPFTILAFTLVALTSVSGKPNFGAATWSSTDPRNHVVIPKGGSQSQFQDNAIPSQTPNTPSTDNFAPSPIVGCPTTQPGSGSSSSSTGKSQIAWCTPLQGNTNETEPVIAWFTLIQPGDVAPPPSNATSNSTETEDAEAETKKTPTPTGPILGSCTPINPDGNGGGGVPPTPGQIGWYTQIPKPDEAPAEPELSPEELSAPGGNVTLGWCTPLLDAANATAAQLGDCRPYEPATPDDGSSASTTTTTTTAKPDSATPKKELLGWYTPLKFDPAAKGSVIAYFIPVVASVPPPKEPVTKDTKAPESSDGDGDADSPPPA